MAIAIVRKKNQSNEFIENVYLINSNNYPIDNILVASHDYGERMVNRGKLQFLDISLKNWMVIVPW